MTATAERRVEVFAKLPLSKLRDVCQRGGVPAKNGATPPTADDRAAFEAIYSLYGCLAGGDMLVHLLQEAVRENEHLRSHPSRRDG